MQKIITLPELHSAQSQIVSEAQRFNVVDCGRRFGKTMLGIDRLVTPETLVLPQAWFSPTYRMLLEVWRACNEVLQPVISRKSEQEKRLDLITGGVIEFWSLDNPDAARGRKYARTIIDEAAMIRRLMDAFNAVIRPALADYQGDAWFLSTPKGHNDFWQFWQWGRDAARPDWFSWQMSTYENPYILPSEIDAMRDGMPERVFRQEILAEFIEDAGVFRNVLNCITAQAQSTGIHGADYVFGVDWGKHNDFTVITVLDVSKRELVHLDRFNQIDYTLQRGRLVELARRFRPVTILAESNSMGEPIIEQLRRDGLPVKPFNTTNATKSAAIEALALAFEREDIKILNDPILIAELQAYEIDRTKTGLVSYSAPDGLHDDCVMSLAIGWAGLQRKPAQFFTYR